MKVRFDLPVTRMLVVLPESAAEAVLATPTLRALRETFPEAMIAWLAPAGVSAVLNGCPWADQVITPVAGGASRAGSAAAGRAADAPPYRALVRLAGRLRREAFDTAVLLNDRIGAALLVRLAGISRRVGYERPGRGMLLTDRLLPLHDGSRLVPMPRLDYHLGVARYLGAADPSTDLQLVVTSAEAEAAGGMLNRLGVGESGRPRILLGAAPSSEGETDGSPRRLAGLADALIERYAATVLLYGTDADRPRLGQVRAAARGELIDLAEVAPGPGVVKAIVGGSDLVVSGDALPRYLAAALGVPVVALRGSREAGWSRLDHPLEREVPIADEAGAADEAEAVVSHAAELIRARPAASGSA